MSTLAVIVQYYGKLKPSFALWSESARRTGDVDFFVFCDDKEPENPADNIKWVNFTLKDFNELAVRKLGVQFKITNPYKLCDFKPMYGRIFEDHIKGYDYWAYGDLDVVYGKIREYLEKIDYRKYSKINQAGHFCIMKNVPQITDLFKEQVPGTRYWKDVLESSNCAFDEIDVNFKARALSIPFFDGIFAADIMNEKGMQCVDKKTVKHVFRRPNDMPAPKNYHYQLFLSENGKITRYYKRFLAVKKDEFCYIHYRLELPVNLSDISQDTYLFSFYPKGFFDVEVPKLQNLRFFMKTVKEYNMRRPLLVEKFSAAVNLTKKFLKKQ